MSGFFARLFGESPRESQFPDSWRTLLAECMPCHRLLDPGEQRRLHAIVGSLLNEKFFEGCNGFEITDRVRLTIASHAALLLLNLETARFPSLKSILVYPDTFIAPRTYEDDLGLVSELDEELVGESWELGAVIFSWREIEEDTRSIGPRNVILHEFAHQIDPMDGNGDWPPHLDGEAIDQWLDGFDCEYARLLKAVQKGSRTFIDEYGAEDPAEFFAVGTETFFNRPRRLQQQHPRLYDAFRTFYRQDPARRMATQAAAGDCGAL
ncbi:MAG: zinc-dependent peptidase [Candidatus Hydrogenedentes bacterium]|nr:zinc-dependent peptidase [Candidatus Hydrogenedentota bacterium]